MTQETQTFVYATSPSSFDFPYSTDHSFRRSLLFISNRSRTRLISPIGRCSKAAS
jgi:hypothetical protein